MGMKSGAAARGKYDLGQNSEINITPFVDVLLVLVIIFMVAIPLATKAIPVDLPTPDPHATKVQPPPVISVEDGGRIFIASQPTTLAHLAADLKARGLTPDQAVAVNAAGDVTYEQFMAVLNQLSADGYLKVSLIAEDVATLRS